VLSVYLHYKFQGKQFRVCETFATSSSGFSSKQKIIIKICEEENIVGERENVYNDIQYLHRSFAHYLTVNCPLIFLVCAHY
jgi:hypothetical protein